MIEVHALKFVEDPLRREPRNVGVFTVSRSSDGGEHAVASRILGERADGSVDGRAIRAPGDITALWAEYFRDKLAQGADRDLERLRNSRPASFYLDHVATLLEEVDVAEALERWWYHVVTPRRVESREELDNKIDAALSAAGLTHVIHGFRFDGRVDDVPLPTEFSYGFQNGQLHLMDKVPTPRQSAAVRRNANDFAWRARLADEADVAHSFVSFVDLNDAPAETEDALIVLHKVSHVVDLARWDEAVETLHVLAGH